MNLISRFQRCDVVPRHCEWTQNDPLWPYKQSSLLFICTHIEHLWSKLTCFFLNSFSLSLVLSLITTTGKLHRRFQIAFIDAAVLFDDIAVNFVDANLWALQRHTTHQSHAYNIFCQFWVKVLRSSRRHIYFAHATQTCWLHTNKLLYYYYVKQKSFCVESWFHNAGVPSLSRYTVV